jgi:protocatechuate 3,4-dioxygenase beta subunit
MTRLLWCCLAAAVLLAGVGAWLAGRDPAAAPSSAVTSAPAIARASRASSLPSSADDEVIASAELWLEGSVIDGSGEPVQGATVVIDTTPPRTVTTDGRGTFAFEEMRPGRHRLVARAQGAYTGPVHVTVDAHTPPVELVLRPAHSLEVTVLDGERDAAPMEGATVDVRDPTRQRSRTDDDGIVRFAAVASGTAWISVAAPERATAIVRVDVPAGRGTLRTRVTLQPGRLIHGVVRDEDGTAVGGAVVATRVGASPAAGSTSTAQDGTFAVLVPADDVILRATAPGLVGAEVGVASGSNDDVELVLGRGRMIAGVVRDEEGKPVAGAIVRGLSPVHEMFESTANAEGTFTLRGIPAVPLEVLAIAGSGLSEPVAVAGGTASVENLEVIVPTVGWIRGVVVDAEGEPLANAAVHAAPDLRARMGQRATTVGRGRLIAIADDEGNFSMKGLRPGRYALRAVGADEAGVDPGTREPTHAATGQADVVVRRLRGGAITGRVVGADGGPALDYRLRVDTGPVVAVRDREGRFLVEAVAAGQHVVTIDGRGIGGFVLDDVAVRESAKTDVGELRDDGGRRLRGRVVDDRGAPVADAHVFAGGSIDAMPSGGIEVRTRAGDLTEDTARTERDGTFEIVGLPPGPLVVVATHATLGRSAGERVEADHTEVSLALFPTGTVRGTVTDRGQPAFGAAVTVASDEAPDVRIIGMVDAAGAFAIEGVPAGAATVTALRQGRDDRQQTVRRVVEVTPGTPTDVQLALASGEGTIRVRFGDPVNRIVMLASGEVDALDVSGFHAAASRGEGVAAVGYSLDGEPTQFVELEAGRYTVCAAALEADVDDPADKRRTEIGGDALPVECTAVDVDDGVSQASL